MTHVKSSAFAIERLLLGLVYQQWGERDKRGQKKSPLM
jgi:hypothetical protein